MNNGASWWTPSPLSSRRPHRLQHAKHAYVNASTLTALPSTRQRVAAHQRVTAHRRCSSPPSPPSSRTAVNASTLNASTFVRYRCVSAHRYQHRLLLSLHNACCLHSCQRFPPPPISPSCITAPPMALVPSQGYGSLNGTPSTIAILIGAHPVVL